MGEADVLREDGGKLLFSQAMWLCASGLVGVAVNFSSFFVIQHISSLMAKLIVVARSAGLVCILILVYGEEWKPLQLVGYLVTLVAFTGYSCLKAAESRELNSDKGGDIEMPPKGQQGNDDGQEDARSDEPLMGASTPQ